VVALSGVLAALLMTRGVDAWLAAAAGVAVGASVGGLNGVLAAYARMPSFIVTLGTMGMVRGMALILTDGNNVSGLPESFRALGGGSWVGVPVPVFCFLAVAIAVYTTLQYTRFGRYCYAIGSNREAAHLSGVPVARSVTQVFVLSGAFAGFAGVIQASRLGIGQPTTGEGLELEAIAAAVIGGASLSGGEGGVAGTLLGALLMSVLRNGGNLLGRKPFELQFLIGAIVILAVFYDYARRRR
jgi:ribose transport system permease protein